VSSAEPGAARRTNERGRTYAVRALVVAACVLLLLALVAGYARRAAVDSDQFANRATAALRDSVRSLVAHRGPILRSQTPRLPRCARRGLSTDFLW
jgi:hypothetical protein